MEKHDSHENEPQFPANKLQVISKLYLWIELFVYRDVIQLSKIDTEAKICHISNLWNFWILTRQEDMYVMWEMRYKNGINEDEDILPRNTPGNEDA